MNVLNQLEYTMISNLLNEEPITRNRGRYVKLVEIITPIIKSRDVKKHGNMESIQHLPSLCRKDDWFRGFMKALYRNNQITLMRDIDSDFTDSFHDELNEKVARVFKDNKPILVCYLRCTECVIGMTGSVDGFDKEFRTKVRETDRKKGTKEANELFLERLETCTDKAKWRSFMNVLKQLEYGMMFKLLNEEPITRDREKYVELVEILTPFIKSHIAPLQLIDGLLEEGCLSNQDKQNLQQEIKNHGNMEGTLLLLSRMTRLKDDWFRRFMTVLYRNDQITLLTVIDPDFTNSFHDKLEFNDKVARAFKDNKPILVDCLRCTECVIGMTGSVDGFDTEFQRKITETYRNQGMKEANELFLKRLETCTDQAKWRSFLNVLTQNDYQMLSKLLKGEPITRNRERCVRLVEILTPSIKCYIAPLQLIDDLLIEGCLNDQDKQNIQQEVKNHGNMEGTLLLLNRITRLKDDWFRGFMTALYRNNQITLMREIDPDFTEKMSIDEEFTRINLDEESNPMSNEKGETDITSAKCISTISTELLPRDHTPTYNPQRPVHYIRNADQCDRPGEHWAVAFFNDDGRGEYFESYSLPSPMHPAITRWMTETSKTCTWNGHSLQGRCISPTLCAPKQLGILDYQEELCEPVTGGKNTAIFAPTHSGKQFILLNIIKNHFAESSDERRVVSVVFPTAARAQRFGRLCAVFLSHLTATLVPDYPFDREKVENCDVVVYSLDIPLCVSILYGYMYDIQYTLLLFELPPTAMCDEQHDLDPYTSLVGPIEECPQVVVVVSRHVNYESYFVDSILKAIQVLALFRVERIAIVTKHLSSLSELCVMDRRPVGSRSENYLVENILSLIGKVEELLIGEQDRCCVQYPDHPLCKMFELSSAPLEKTSVTYMVWLKTNSATLKDLSTSFGFTKLFNTLFNILKILHNALLINSEARSQDALQYITERLEIDSVPNTLTVCFQDVMELMFCNLPETITYMENNCSEVQDDPMAMEVRKKLVELFSNDEENCKVVVVLRHQIALSYLHEWLTRDEVLKDVDCFIFKSYQEELPAFTETMGNGTKTVLLTTSSLLIDHVQSYSWDCIIRTDFPDNCLMSWTKKPNIRTENEVFQVNCMLNMEFEKCLWEINDLCLNKEEEFQGMLTIHRKLEQEKRFVGYENIPVFVDSSTDIYCHGCGKFRCNEANVRKLNKMWLALDEGILRRAKIAGHPNPIVFGHGYGKLAQFVCKCE